ncbi:DNA methyltransferase [Solidesulfovibrio carbinolicus]|nr:DNA methyltransferase [Solidesulfovibrio carbinolicus]
MKETSLFDSLLEEPQQPSGPVACLGMTFENDEARRAHFTQELREKLRDPDFRKIEGFPIGSDEDILNLSDPPYYTACPNPWIADFIAEWEAQKPIQPEGYHYHREPFAADVSEGKNDPVYNAHSYHTKVPHKAIMRYILHYTEPGHIVLDGFCGTGMTGVAAQMCGESEVVRSLGYQVKPDGTILQEETGEGTKKAWTPFSRLGARNGILNDLSPAATFITASLNRTENTKVFIQYSRKILEDVRNECGWMFETAHGGSKQKGNINYVIWSDVLLCTECGEEFVYWNEAVQHENNHVNKQYVCPHCSFELTRRELERKVETIFDVEIGKGITRPKQVPVLINYSVGKKRFEKSPDDFDIELVRNLENRAVPYSLPTELMMFKGTEWGDLFRGYHIGTTHVHHFYTKRNRWILSSIFARINECPKPIRGLLTAWFTGSQSRLTRLNRYMPDHGRHVGPLSGTYYMSSLPTEISPFYFFASKISDFSQIGVPASHAVAISTNSTTRLQVPDACVDYIFTDPPFGDNLPYSELNFLWESWLRVYTQNTDEAIVSKIQRKSTLEYMHLMEQCFREYYRVLKAGRWITVEFHNSKNSIWNAIQGAMGHAGFVISDVRTLDKKKGTTKQLSYMSGAVKQDLVLTAYKPNGGLEDRFKLEAGTEDGVWDFVSTHLKNLPVFVIKHGQIEAISERQHYLLFDRMVAFHVQRGVSIPLSASEFYSGLTQRFSERDGMYFLAEQVAEYDKRRLTVTQVTQLQLFVSDEASARQWLIEELKDKPQTFQEIHPHFMKQLGGWNKNETPLELLILLEQNFLRYDGKGPVPGQIHSYLSSNWKELRNLPKDDPTLVAKARDRWYLPDPTKAGDLEKLREKALLKEFEEYKDAKKKLKVFRLEAVRAGFKKAWQERDYAVIVAVADKIPNNVLEEDPKLLMWYDQAVTRMGGE